MTSPFSTSRSAQARLQIYFASERRERLVPMVARPGAGAGRSGRPLRNIPDRGTAHGYAARTRDDFQHAVRQF